MRICTKKNVFGIRMSPTSTHHHACQGSPCNVVHSDLSAIACMPSPFAVEASTKRSSSSNVGYIRALENVMRLRSDAKNVY